MGPVLQSDLYRMGFDPAERGELYGGEGRFDPLKAQEQAVAQGSLPTDLAGEVEKIRQSDLLVLHFPIWWFGPPAMLKGWFDRALVHTALHSAFERFDAGPCAGKWALFCVSTGCNAAECAPDGVEGDLRLLLWPLAQALRYCGFTVLEPLAAHSVHGYHEPPEKAALDQRLADVLARQASVLQGLATHPIWPFNADSDFDAAGRLRPEVPSLTPFIRHR
jgi:NAD(P)H dehydrogenase (quinone)